MNMGRVYQNDNQLLIPELVNIYKPSGVDWLSYQITRSNILTVHHVIKLADGGILSIDNAALLTKKSHRGLNMCESRDFILYSEINDFFMQIISRRAPLDDDLIRESKEYKRALTMTLYK